jgi:NhaP-type Na+/H+ or K+/H+ antiporter
MVLDVGLTLLSLVLVFVMPIGITNIGWKMYMINAAWDVIFFVLIVSVFLQGSMHCN